MQVSHHAAHCLTALLPEQAPNTLVLHTRAGNCFGDMAAYDYFSLGGPYSVRGYSPGELGACRRFLETAAEVRVPLKNHGLAGERRTAVYGMFTFTCVLFPHTISSLSQLPAPSAPGTAYAFVEYGTDLSSGRALDGNPTEYYRKAGSGMSLGVGLKVLGACRFEYARDCNAGKNSVLVNWGERF